MKSNKSYAALIGLAIFFVLNFSCKKNAQTAPDEKAIDPETVAKIRAMGFSTYDLKAIDNGCFLVEKDMVLTPEDLATGFANAVHTEQFRTTNLVGGPFPRNIRVKAVGGAGAAIVQALVNAVARFNAAGLTKLSFTAVPFDASADISIFPDITVLNDFRSSFPSASGRPGATIAYNPNRVPGSASGNVLTSIIAHEIGHCIGFRHTDWFNRSFSCGIGGSEGPAGIGAELIPGTPVAPDPFSWMLACNINGVNRPFSATDLVALRTLY